MWDECKENILSTAAKFFLWKTNQSWKKMIPLLEQTVHLIWGQIFFKIKKAAKIKDKYLKKLI